MKKYITVAFLLAYGICSAQVYETRLGLYSNGLIKRYEDTIRYFPNTPLGYINLFGQPGSLPDTVRTFFSVVGTGLSYNPATGVFTYTGSASTGVDSIWRTAGQDSIKYSIAGRLRSIKDSSGGGGGGTPAGTDNDIQYNLSSAFAASTTFKYFPTATASSSLARGHLINPALTAAANNDTLVGTWLQPTYTVGAFTNVKKVSAYFKDKIYITGSPDTSGAGVGNDVIIRGMNSTVNSGVGIDLHALGSLGGQRYTLVSTPTGGFNIQNNSLATGIPYLSFVNGGAATFNNTVTSGTGAASVFLGLHATIPALWIGLTSRTTGNYAVYGDGATNVFNSPGDLLFRTNNSAKGRIFNTTGNWLFTSGSTDNGARVQTTSYSSAYTATAVSLAADATHNVIDVTATGQTITLPTAVSKTGTEYTIKLTGVGTGTVATTSSQTIDGSTTYSLSAQYKYVTVKSTGANWIIIANN
jgi:hypothetical protein